MDATEFDKFADEYAAMHGRSVRLSGESPAFFAEYKVREMVATLGGAGLPRAILDFGTGIGASVPFLRKYFPRASLTCVDVSKRSLAIAAERYPGEARFEAFDGRSLPFADGTFGAAIAACVFHHIAPVEHVELLRELCRVLRARGSMFVFEHNPWNPLTVHAVRTCEFDANARLIRAATMARRMREAGFLDVTVRYGLFFPRPLAPLRPLERWMGWLPIGAQYHVRGCAPG